MINFGEQYSKFNIKIYNFLKWCIDFVQGFIQNSFFIGRLWINFSVWLTGCNTIVQNIKYVFLMIMLSATFYNIASTIIHIWKAESVQLQALGGLRLTMRRPWCLTSIYKQNKTYKPKKYRMRWNILPMLEKFLTCINYYSSIYKSIKINLSGLQNIL